MFYIASIISLVFFSANVLNVEHEVGRVQINQRLNTTIVHNIPSGYKLEKVHKSCTCLSVAHIDADNQQSQAYEVRILVNGNTNDDAILQEIIFQYTNAKKDTVFVKTLITGEIHDLFRLERVYDLGLLNSQSKVKKRLYYKNLNSGIEVKSVESKFFNVSIENNENYCDLVFVLKEEMDINGSVSEMIIVNYVSNDNIPSESNISLFVRANVFQNLRLKNPYFISSSKEGLQFELVPAASFNNIVFESVKINGKILDKDYWRSSNVGGNAMVAVSLPPTHVSGRVLVHVDLLIDGEKTAFKANGYLY